MSRAQSPWPSQGRGGQAEQGKGRGVVAGQEKSARLSKGRPGAAVEQSYLGGGGGDANWVVV